MGTIPINKKTIMTHQFNLFPWQKPKAKIPISAARIQELKDSIANGDVISARTRMRDLLDHVQNIERNITNGKYETPPKKLPVRSTGR